MNTLCDKTRWDKEICVAADAAFINALISQGLLTPVQARAIYRHLAPAWQESVLGFSLATT